jgi:ATP-binding cassette, subfamily B, bacterial
MADIKKSRQIAAHLWRTWRGYRLQAGLNTAIGLLQVVLSLAFVWTTKLTIDIATHVRADLSLTVAIVLLVVIMVAQISLSFASRWVRAILGVKATNRMQRRIFARLLTADWNALRQFHTGNLLNRLERDVQTVIMFLTESLPTFVCTLFQFVGAFLFLFWMDRDLACLVVVIIPFFLVCSKLYVKKMRHISHEIRDQESRIQSVMQEGLQHTLIVKTLRCTAFVVDRLASLQDELHRQTIGKTRYTSLSATLLSAGFGLGYLVAFVWGVSSLQKGLITYGALIAFIQLVGQIQGPVRTLSRFVPVFIEAFTATERLMELEAIEQEPQDEATSGANSSSTNSSAAASAAPSTLGIRLENITFAYPPRGDKASRNIFQQFSYDFPPATVSAVVGETGAGKTTLIRLLLSLVRPQEGQAHLYAPTGETMPIGTATRTFFSYVPQGNTLISGTIRENLQLGCPTATDEEMFAALADASAAFVAELPQGLDARCGEMGDGLSEGQAQRIAIARALLHRAPILLLDEATSSLDEETERRVLANIVGHYPQTTIVLITHRPEALRHAKQVLRLAREVGA